MLRVARWLLRLALRMGATPPMRFVLRVHVDGHLVALMHDEQMQWQARLDGGVHKISLLDRVEISIEDAEHLQDGERIGL